MPTLCVLRSTKPPDIAHPEIRVIVDNMLTPNTELCYLEGMEHNPAGEGTAMARVIAAAYL